MTFHVPLHDSFVIAMLCQKAEFAILQRDKTTLKLIYLFQIFFEKTEIKIKCEDYKHRFFNLTKKKNVLKCSKDVQHVQDQCMLG